MHTRGMRPNELSFSGLVAQVAADLETEIIKKRQGKKAAPPPTFYHRLYRLITTLKVRRTEFMSDKYTDFAEVLLFADTYKQVRHGQAPATAREVAVLIQQTIDSFNKLLEERLSDMSLLQEMSVFVSTLSLIASKQCVGTRSRAA